MRLKLPEPRGVSRYTRCVRYSFVQGTVAAQASFTEAIATCELKRTLDAGVGDSNKVRTPFKV